VIALEKVHTGYVYGRRVSVLANSIEPLIPSNASVLDLGCGDGIVSHKIVQERGDIELFGVDVLLRSSSFFPSVSFDGCKLPFGTGEFDVVMLIDVLHHTRDVSAIFLEAARVSKEHLLIKDHLADRILAKPTLRFMDIVGNLRYGVSLPFIYLSKSDWLELFQDFDLKIEEWNQDLGLYPWWANWLFGRSLHFLVRLQK